jgi:methionine sulfoxide reductase heme-binding subunit
MAVVERLNAVARVVPRPVVYLLGLGPLAFLVAAALRDNLGVDPVRELEQRLGLLGFQFLLLGLAITPLRRLTGFNLVFWRRPVGLLAFVHVLLHLLTWIFLDLGMRWGQIGTDLVKRPFIIVGMLGFVALLPLALTSNDWSVRRLGAARWRRLHLLTYAAMLLGAVHYLMLAKVWSAEPLVYAGLALTLVAVRLVWLRAFRQPRTT